MEALAAGQSRVDPWPCLVDAQAERRHHALYQRGQGSGGGQPHRGQLEAALPIHPDLPRSVHQHVGHRGIGEQWCQRAEAGQLVGDGPHGRGEGGRRQHDALVAQCRRDRRLQVARRRVWVAVGPEPPLDAVDQGGSHFGGGGAHLFTAGGNGTTRLANATRRLADVL